ncbi:MAG: type II/IV secretion system protein [Nitrospinae bacterium]|nr:type II/IV secretion system protein [Nitrospinota bacterium]
MSVTTDIRKLAQLLLKEKRIDRQGFDKIMSNLAESEKAVASTVKSSAKGKQSKPAPGHAIRFIAGLKVPSAANAEKFIAEEEIVKAISSMCGLPYKKIDPLELDIDTVTRTIPKPFALKHMVLPLYQAGDELHVAVMDPETGDTLDGLSRATGKKIVPFLATPGDINKLINEFYGFKTSVTRAEEEMSKKRIDLGNLEQLNRIKQPDQIQSDDEHIKNAVDYLFNYGFEMRVSDIHIEPKRDNSVVRFRIDGQLNEVYKIPKGVSQAIASRIKMLARMNIAEKRKPQDGRIRVEHGGDTSELRVSTLPAAFGEKLVLRVLKPDQLMRDMDLLGLFPEDIIKIERFLNRPNGIILVTGPTGSGKTTTLYSALNFLSSPEKNIVTIEDPIETICEQFNQTAVQPAIGLTFAAALRSILRQDPDIIMIGEIRDQETADNAIQSALTGHLVLSTLHTNDTTSSIARLRDLGVQPFLINATVVGIVAQRLVRMVCKACAKEVEVSAKRLKQFGIVIKEEKAVIKEGKGCDQCRFTGFLGRTGVYEVLAMDDNIRQMVQEAKSDMEIRKYALAHGMTTIRDSAVRKMLNGETTLREVVQLGYQL